MDFIEEIKSQPLNSLTRQYYQTQSKQQQSQRTKSDSSRWLKRFRDKPFWINDKGEHEKEYDRTAREENGRTVHECCFNHIIGLPRKDGKPFRLFDYETDIILPKLWEHKYIW